MSFVDVIAKKRDGHALSREDIYGFVGGVTAAEIPEYQAAALLMAIVIRGMSDEETGWLTDAMARSGSRVDLSDIPGVKIGKHSTGGVGDKVSIVLAPLAAACGVVVPKMSGRGLGHTGGTVDKLESIPGYRTDLTIEEFKRILRTVGASIIGQSASLAPADKRLYALRDVTATIESIPLIASSIMSKKFAEGCDALILDVKTGDGAFMKDLATSRTLAATMVTIGKGHGLRTEAMITDMETPLGRAVGNALEIIECLEMLQGGGPEDLRDIAIRVAARMVVLAGIDTDETAATTRVRRALASGQALDTFRRMIEAHGGDPRIVDEHRRLAVAADCELVRTPRPGFVERIGAESIGRASCALGAGRTRVGDPIDHTVGVVVLAQRGEAVREGQPVLEIRHRAGAGLPEAVALCQGAIVIADAPPPPPPLVLAEVR
jgi:pyrimidine-nucleoside phosphorylase/thymidine phosphorylase